MREFVSHSFFGEIIRIRVSDQMEEEIKETQEKLKSLTDNDYRITAEKRYTDYDSMKECYPILVITPDKYEFIEDCYDGPNSLGPDIGYIGYMMLGHLSDTYHRKYWRPQTSREKSEYIKFLTGKERLECIAENIR
jgi:hypothetical protein